MSDTHDDTAAPTEARGFLVGLPALVRWPIVAAALVALFLVARTATYLLLVD